MKRPLLVVACLFLAPPLGAADRVALRVTPSFAFAPATVEIVATVHADRSARAIEVAAESDDYFRSSMVPLDETSPRANRFRFRDLPGGVYTISATLLDASGASTVVREHVRIIDQY
jgi:hypothetical protein